KLIKGHCCVPRFDMVDTRQKRHPAAFKAKVALEPVKQTRFLAELARAFPVHKVRISQWKKQLLDGAEPLFGNGRRREQAPPRTLSSAPKSAGAPQDGQSLKAGPAWLDPTSSRFSR